MLEENLDENADGMKEEENEQIEEIIADTATEIMQQLEHQNFFENSEPLTSNSS